ncbi:MAG: tRNA pseudouridine(55) synthase TruB [Clostridia bacterium]|nr:tRNA pseudouridine(55) synthase TruB [Clostridia bacterium]
MDGIILINKTKGCTSHDVVYKVKKMLNEKVGHTGTLDPMATGVLPLLIGKGTLCSKYLINHDKKYQVVLQLGKKTTTADSEGEIIEEDIIEVQMLDEVNITKVLKSFIGQQEQIPPIYSAIKVNGKKLYEYARSGQKVEIKPRTIEIYDIKLLNINKELKQISFEVSCSKGTYIRSLCEDIAKSMHTIGFMQELHRIQVGNFKIEDTITVDELEAKFKENTIEKSKSFISIEQLFNQNEKIELDNKKLQLFINGVKLSFDMPDGVYRIYNKAFVGIGIVEKGLLKRDIVL